MKSIIKRILREEIMSESFQSISYGSLSNEDKKNIKEKGVEIFNKFKLVGFEKLNNFFKEHGLYYGYPNVEYLKSNIQDITFALKEIDLPIQTKNKLREFKDNLEQQLNSIERFEKGELPKKGRYFEYFQEIPKKEEEKMVWSIVNLFDNNIMVWVKLINDWLSSEKRTKKITSIPNLINYYFEMDNGKKAFKDLIYAMVERNDYQEKIINKTWGGGQKVEQNFISKLLSNGFGENNIHVFSGEKNIIDGIGIDLAVKCGNKWIPIQVKSSDDDARNAIPYKGLATYPDGDTFKLISKLKDKKNYRDLNDICKPLNEPIFSQTNKTTEEPSVELPVKRGTPPPNVDYLGWMEKQK